MSETARAVVREGRIELLDSVELPEGANLIITLVPSDESRFWLGASQTSLDAIWNNSEDDVYAQLLEK